jgi:DNA recombination protein RmuC
MSLTFFWGLLVGGALVGLVGFFVRRAILARIRLESASRVSTAEAIADNERTRRGEALAVARREVDRSELEIQGQREFLEHSKKELENSFKALATAVLEGNTRQFLGLAEERFNRSRTEARGDLEKRKQAIEALIDPLKEMLEKLENRTGEIERARVDAYAKINEQVHQLMEQTLRLEQKTTSLNVALRGSQVRGRWGEIALRNIAELSGMTEHCDFSEQETLPDARRPDMVVKLPGRRLIAVDAKAPLIAYLAALEETSESKRNEALDRHVSDLRGHIRALAGRNYAEGLNGKVDLVVMFLPGDPYLAAAFARAPDLQTEALRAKILIATPTTLIALLRTVAIYWQQRSVAENAEQIAAVARKLYERAAVFADHLEKMGKGLRGAVDAYNQAVSSFERRLVPMGRQLEDMKVTEHTTRQLELPEGVEEMPREVSP